MRSLRSQLSLAMLFMILVTIAFISVFANMAVNRQFEEYIARQEQTRCENIAGDLSRLYGGAARGWDPDSLHAIGMYSLYDGYVLTVSDAAGKKIWDAENHDMSLCREIMGDISERMSRREKTGGFTTRTYPLTQGERKVGSVSIKAYGPYFFQENDFRFIRALNALLLTIGLISCAFSVAAGTLLAKRIARPITKTAEIAKQIAKGNYHIRFEGETKTRELDALGSSINSLTDALDRQEQYRERMTADVAHELRTPLAAIRSHLEAMAEGLWEATPERLESCLEEVKRFGSLIADLERLAAIEQDHLKLNRSEIDLLKIARAVGRSFEKEADEKAVSITVGGASSFVPADSDRVSQVVANLISNAIKYTREGGHIRVEVTDSAADGTVVVEDDGIGIPEKDLPFIFERFYRADRSRSRQTGGAGIGLAIVKSIVEAHGGSVSAESREAKGSRFTVSFPKQGKR